MRENEKIIIDVEKLFPEAARRVKILEDLQKSWAGVVGIALARNSFPEVLGVDGIKIFAANQKTLSMLSNMKGNITRALKKRYDYDLNNDFEVKIQLTHQH